MLTPNVSVTALRVLAVNSLKSSLDDMGGVLCSIVGYEFGASNVWLCGSDMDKYCKSQPVIEKARVIFGKGNVRANLKGIPDVFTSKEALQKLLYPTQREWGTR